MKCHGKHGMESWEMMREAKDLLGMPALQRIFSVGHGVLYKTMRNPDFVGDTARPPIQRVRMMLHDLANAGGEDLAHAMLNYMAEALGMHLEPNATAVPDCDDVRDECLDDLPPLAVLHSLIQCGADVREVEAQGVVVKREVDETVVAYRNSLEG